VLLIDAAGNVTFGNRAGLRMLGSGDGLRLTNLTGKPGLGQLVADNALANRAIAAALRATLNRDPFGVDHFSDSVLVPRITQGTSYALQFSSLGNQSEFGTGSAASAIVFVADGEQSIDVDPALLQSAYGLSRAEARVAITLLEVSSVSEVSECLNVSTNTVNTHLKKIYSKLGVDTRARFVKLMMGLAVRRS
jgi:DNA-binding CsgD family transcriptional regulator